MEGIIKMGEVIFVKDEETSDGLIDHYLAEHKMDNYRLKVDRTLTPPYYELFLDYIKREQDGRKRKVSIRMFASSSLEKIKEYYFY